jgi:glycosyltransferase involved in cell wall biosynthesis
MRVLTCLGDATSIQTWSNTPYFFLEAGKRAAFLDAGWQLDPGRLRLKRLAWNAWKTVRHGEPGGFQYSAYFLQQLLAQARTRMPAERNAEIISHFPLFPPHEEHAGQTSYYIDATLAQNFEDYGLAVRGIGRRMATDAMMRERDQYAAAKHIICMSRWAARSVVQRYGIDAKKVHIVPAGSNLDGNTVRSLTCDRRASLSPVRLGFVGKDWKRKNLPFVLEVADVLNSRRVEVEVVAAGFAPAEGPRHALLRPIGFIDKHNDMQRFMNFIGACHFTCLFSSAEAFGISNRESLRLGVPVLARDIGGIPDTVPEGCGHLFAREALPCDVADVIEAYVRDPQRYWQLQKDVFARSDEFTWDVAVNKMQRIWAGSNAYSYTPTGAVHA